eukprot:scaffold168768_cov37-Tisochrysis_lutea.AAC.1
MEGPAGPSLIAATPAVRVAMMDDESGDGIQWEHYGVNAEVTAVQLASERASKLPSSSSEGIEAPSTGLASSELAGVCAKAEMEEAGSKVASRASDRQLLLRALHLSAELAGMAGVQPTPLYRPHCDVEEARGNAVEWPSEEAPVLKVGARTYASHVALQHALFRRVRAMLAQRRSTT